MAMVPAFHQITLEPKIVSPQQPVVGRPGPISRPEPLPTLAVAIRSVQNSHRFKSTSNHLTFGCIFHSKCNMEPHYYLPRRYTPHTTTMALYWDGHRTAIVPITMAVLWDHRS